MKCAVFLHVMPFCLEVICEDSEKHVVCVTRRGEERSILFYPQHAGSRFLRNLDAYLQNYVSSHPKRQ
jgi:hypothetical protein